MVTTHDKGYMLVFTTFVHIYIFLWEPIVHDHSGSKWGGAQIEKNRGIEEDDDTLTNIQ